MPQRPPTLRYGVDAPGEFDKRRRKAKPSRRWYSLKAWRDRRAAQLAHEPTCRMHREQTGQIVIATVADHVVPHREDPRLFWHGELQSLCASCHSSVKQREERQG